MIKPNLNYILNTQFNGANKSTVTLPAAQRNLWRSLNKTIMEHMQETCKRQMLGINLQLKWDGTEHVQKGLESWENRGQLQLSAQERFNKSSDRESRRRWGSDRKQKAVSKVGESLMSFFLPTMWGQGATEKPAMTTDGGAAGGEGKGQTGTTGGQQAGDPASPRKKKPVDLNLSFYGLKKGGKTQNIKTKMNWSFSRWFFIIKINK